MAPQGEQAGTLPVIGQPLAELRPRADVERQFAAGRAQRLLKLALYHRDALDQRRRVADRGIYVRKAGDVVERLENLLHQLGLAACLGQSRQGLLAHGQHANRHVEDESHSLLRLIGEEPADIDGIIERSGLTPGRASALLVTLEVEGRIRQLEGKRFVQVSLG